MSSPIVPENSSEFSPDVAIIPPAVSAPPSKARFEWRWIIRSAGRVQAIGQTALSELLLLAGKLNRLRSRSALDAALRDCGAAAIRQQIDFPEAAENALCNEGITLSASIASMESELMEVRGHLKSLTDRKSIAYSDTRHAIEGRKREVKNGRDRIVVVHKELGQAVILHAANDPQLATEVNRYRAAMDRLQTNERAVAAQDAVRLQSNARIGIGFRKLCCGAAVLAWIVIALSTMRGGAAAQPTLAPAATTVAAVRPSPTETKPIGLTRAQLRLSAQYVEVQWTAWRPSATSFWGDTPAPDVTKGFSGSSGVVGTIDGDLMLVTNRHVLALSELAAAKANRGLAVKDYRLAVQFPSGRSGIVKQCALEGSGIDIAVLRLDRAGLQEGIDYVILPKPPANLGTQVGDDVVAIGNPAANGAIFGGTQTFGHISAIRSFASEGEFPETRFLQTDAAINHGNSGGPLLLKSADRYFWVGINTLAMGRDESVQGINLAIEESQLRSSKFFWFDATPSGAAQVLTSLGCPTGEFQH